jgi:hypothetical protein
LLSNTWKKFTIPIPDPTRLPAIDGLFSFGVYNQTGSIWFDDIEFGVNDLTVGGLAHSSDSKRDPESFH